MIKKLIPIIFLIGVAIVFFNQIIFQDKILATGDLFRSDIINYCLPVKHQVYQVLRRGELPLWSNLINTGFPLLAETNLGLFYPFNLILTYLLPFVKAYNYSLVLNFLVGFLGAYVLSRYQKLSAVASVYSSIAFGLSGFLITQIQHHNIISSGVWMPWLWYLFWRLWETKKVRFGLIAAFLFAFQIFAGGAQIALYSLVSIFLFFCVYDYLEKKKLTKEVIKQWIAWGGILVIFFSLGLLIAAIQVLPAMELTSESTRKSGLGLTALSFSYRPRDLITLVVPYHWRDPGINAQLRLEDPWGMFWETTSYVGVLTLVLALLGLLPSRKKTLITWSLLLFWVLMICLALGAYGPLFWVFLLPVINNFRVPARFLLTSTLALAILAGFGFDKLRQLLVNKYSQYTVRLISLIAILILIVDLFKFANQLSPVVDFKRIVNEPETVEMLKKGQLTPRRYYSINTLPYYQTYQINSDLQDTRDLVIQYQNSLSPNINMIYNVPSVDGYSGLFLNENFVYQIIIRSGLNIQGEKIVISPESMKILSLMSTDYLVANLDLENESLKIQKKTDFNNGPNYRVYKNQSVFPRSYLVAKEIIEDFDNKQLAEEEKSMKEEIISYYETVKDKYSDRVVIEKDEVTKINIVAKNEVPSWLVLADTYYPGWKATLDGQPTTIKNINGMFRLIYLPEPGEHQVEFVYQPDSFFWGKVITLTTLGLLLIFYPRKLKDLDLKRWLK